MIAWRKERGMTMVELAQKADMLQGHLSRLERGHLPYNQQSLERFEPVVAAAKKDGVRVRGA